MDITQMEKASSFAQWFTSSAAPWLLDHGIKIAAIIIVTIILRHILKYVIERGVRKAVGGSTYTTERSEVMREDTLIQLFTGAGRIIIWLIAVMMILSEVCISIGPLLAGAGIAGVAFGFGAQYLVRDIINGLFIILENQFRVGDVVCFGETCGTVEHVTLRVTILRDIDGVVHYVPNGEVKQTSNMSQDFSRVNMNIGISYSADVEDVIPIINAVGEEMSKDEEWGPKIKKAPAFLRVDSFGDSSVNLKVLGDVEPLEQWAVAGEFRRRLKAAFDKNGVEIPFPQRVMHYMKEGE